MSNNQSPVVGFKIAIVNNADLHNEYKVVKAPTAERPEVTERQFVRASKRQARAIRKARLMGGRDKNIVLFGERQDGTHFPVSLRPRTVA
jgi:hypothetical protein